MRVTMLENRRVTTDGVNTIDAEAGHTYEMGDGVAATLIAHGSAERSDLDEKSLDPVDENKDAGDAAHTKTTTKRSSRKRSSKATT